MDGPLPKLCPAVTLSHQVGRHSAVALLLKAALIQVSDYRLLGASGYCTGSYSYLKNQIVFHLIWKKILYRMGMDHMFYTILY
jgi:hypothetical protein